MAAFLQLARVYVAIVISALILYGCSQDSSGQAGYPTQAPSQQVASQGAQAVLSELQITACQGADEAQTCDTRLKELDIVTKENCCAELGLCC